MLKSERPMPYVGISGVAHTSEHVLIAAIADQREIKSVGRFAMIGVQATTKTQLSNIANKHGKNWYPVGDDLRGAAVMDQTSRTQALVHVYSQDLGQLPRLVEVTMERAHGWVSGIQLNQLPWMDIDIRPLLADCRAYYPTDDLPVVLQCHRSLMEQYSAIEISARLALYQADVDYVLFDASHGEGRQINLAQILPFIEAVYQDRLPIGVVLAGGLSAENLILLEPVAAKFSDISIDAESALRHGQEGQTRLDMAKVEAYVAAAIELFKSG